MGFLYCDDVLCSWCGSSDHTGPRDCADHQDREATALADAQAPEAAKEPPAPKEPASVDSAPTVPPSGVKEEPVPTSPNPLGNASGEAGEAAPGASLTPESPTSQPSMPGSAPAPLEPGRP